MGPRSQETPRGGFTAGSWQKFVLQASELGAPLQQEALRQSKLCPPSRDLGESVKDMAGQRLEGGQMQEEFNRTVAELQELLLGRNVQTEMSLPELLDLTINYVQKYTQHLRGAEEGDSDVFPVDWIGDLVFLLSATGQIVKSTSACRRTLGVEPDKLRGRDLYDFVHWTDVPALTNAIKKVRMLRGPQRVSVQMVGRRLQRVQADASIVPVTVDGQPGALFSAICTNANQPPNPRQELSLVARGQGPLPATYRGFFIHTTDFHITAAFSGHMNQTLFGRPSAFWVSESPYTHIHPEDVQVVRGLHKEAVQSSQAVMLYDRVNDGSRGWSMCENLLLPCINRNTGQVQYLASTTWLQEEGSSSMPTRISESKCVPNTEPIFFGSLLELTERFSQMAVQARDAHAASVEALESGKEARIMEEFVKTKLQPQRISVTTHQGPNPDIVLPHNYMSKDESTTPAGFTPIPEGVMSVLAALPPDQINSGIVHALRSYGLVPYTNPDGTVTAQTFPVPGVDFSLPGANENSNQLKALNTASLNSNAANVSIGNVPTNQQTPPGRNIPGNSTSLPHDSHHHSTANNPFLIGRLSFVPDQSMPMPGNHSQHTSQQPNLVHPNPAFHLPSSNAHQHRVDAWGHNQIQNQPPNPSNQSNQSGGTVSMETDHVISQAQQAPPFLGLRPAAPMSAREAEMMHAIEQHLFMMENMDSTNVNTSGMK